MLRPELQLRLPNSPGALASVCQLLADERVNIIAMSLTAGGQLHVIVDNPTRATHALRGRHHNVSERDVVFVSSPATPGSLATLLRHVSAAGINIDYAYAAQAEGAQHGSVVLGVDDAQRAAAASGL